MSSKLSFHLLAFALLTTFLQVFVQAIPTSDSPIAQNNATSHSLLPRFFTSSTLIGTLCPYDFGFRPEWTWADYNAIVSGLDYLLHKETQPCGASARSCSRLSCSYNSGIYLCNDNDYDIAITCNDAVMYAMWVVNHCYGTNVQGNAIIKGQVFDQGNWNVVVRGDNC